MKLSKSVKSETVVTQFIEKARRKLSEQHKTNHANLFPKRKKKATDKTILYHFKCSHFVTK